MDKKEEEVNKYIDDFQQMINDVIYCYKVDPERSALEIKYMRNNIQSNMDIIKV